MRSKRFVPVLCAIAVVIAGACTDHQPVSSSLPIAAPGGIRADVAFPTDAAGYEYEPDTGELACPAILQSHVQYWVNINAVGPRLFTFYAPHVRQTYLGKGVYRYRMTIGKSHDGQWMAEGSWTGRCIGFGQWGIGKVLTFEGTIWRVSDDLACGGSGGGGDTGLAEVSYYGDEYDPYSAYETTNSGGADCPTGGGGSGGGDTDSGSGTQYQPGDYTGGEMVDWGTGIGNGGTSECGLAAQVEFVCIDEYNPDTDEWEHWGCGWATTC